VKLPTTETRLNIIKNLLKHHAHQLTLAQLNSLANDTEGYSGSDLTALCKDAALQPIREIAVVALRDLNAADVRAISHKDFENSLSQIKPSVSTENLKAYESWNKEFGSVA